MIDILQLLNQKLTEMRSRTPNPLHAIYSIYELRIDKTQVFTLDLTANGSVSAGSSDGRAECVIWIPADCVDSIAANPADVGKLLSRKRIRISNRLRAAQLLEALWPGALKEVVDPRIFAGLTAQPAHAQSTKTEDFFGKELPERLRQNPRMFGFVHVEYQVDVTGAGIWTVDMTGDGQVRSGPAKRPKCIISAHREHFEKALADPRLAWPMANDGQIRATDTCRAAQFLRGLFPNALQQSMPPVLYHSMFPNAALIPSAPEYNSGGTMKKGYVMGPKGLCEISYAAIDGNAIFEGDIVLGTVAEMERVVASVNRGARALADFEPEGVRIINWSNPQAYVWPRGVFVYHNTYETDSIPQEVHDAIANITANTAVTFKEKQEGDLNWVTIKKGTGCSSSVGMQGGEQFITLEKNCGTGAIIHEICHALGLMHEQSRLDRDTYVEILWDNIQDDKKYNFDKGNPAWTEDLDAYDYGSIMHYDAYAFAKDSMKKTIKTIPNDVPIGQRNGLSPGDVQALASMYPALVRRAA